MTPEQFKTLVDAMDSGNDQRIVTIALSVAATAARERKQSAAIEIRDLVDRHMNRDEIERTYRESRRLMAAQIMAGLMANPGGPIQSNAGCGWSLTNCQMQDVAGMAVEASDALIRANNEMPVPGIDP